MIIRPTTRTVARSFVAQHHSHHEPHVGEVFTLGAFVTRVLVAVSVLGRPIATPLDDGETWEVTRLCVGPDAPRFTASRLLGASSRVALAAGVTLLTSYTRVDERGSCYLAANWHPVALVRGREHTTGNRALRWLPGLYEPSTEVINRVRWELGPRSRAMGTRPALVWNGTCWGPEA